MTVYILSVKAKGLEGLAHLIYHFIQFVWLNFSDQSPDHKLPKEGLKIKYLTIFNNFNVIIVYKTPKNTLGQFFIKIE